MAVAHGTRDPAGADAVAQVVAAVRARRPEVDVRLASVELVPPDVETALATVPADRRVVVVPLLLSSGYHDRVDIPAAVDAARPDAVRSRVLGPDPLLAVALADRLAEAGWRPGDAVVLAAAGSSEPGAVASVHDQAALLAAELMARASRRRATADKPDHGLPIRPHPARDGGPNADGGPSGPGSGGSGRSATVTVGFGAAAEPDVAAAVTAARAAGARRVAVSPYLLAPGFFAARLREAGADVVAGPLGAHPAVVDLVLRRFDEHG